MMSFTDTLTPSVDSDTNESRVDPVSALNGDPEGEFVTVTLLKGTMEESDSEKSSPVENVLKKNDHEDFKPVDYRGTMTRPLAYFGIFEMRSETKDLPWIYDNTSGVVHPDMHSISMLFNEYLTLPEAAKHFVEQSLVLTEEARWERLKAAFYGFYPEGLQKQVFEVLNEMLRRDASQIIAMKTLRFENEIVLEPRPKATDYWAELDSENESNLTVEADTRREEDAMKLNKLFQGIARGYGRTIALALEGFESIKKKVFRHFYFLDGDDTITAQQILEKSVPWTEQLEAYTEATWKCIDARLFFHHLDHAVARYEPRTGWIHVKTQLLRPGPEEKKRIPKELFRIELSSEYIIKGSLESQNAAVDNQMAHFELELWTLATSHVDTLDFDHNLPLTHEYEVRIPYDSIDPSFCEVIVRELLPQDGWNYYHIPSRPQVLPYTKLHHVLVVYMDLERGKVPQSVNSTFNATSEYIDRYGCCLNCFSRDHVAVGCEQPVYGFAHPLGETGM